MNDRRVGFSQWRVVERWWAEPLSSRWHCREAEVVQCPWIWMGVDASGDPCRHSHVCRSLARGHGPQNGGARSKKASCKLMDYYALWS